MPSATDSGSTVAIIGAGVSGLVCARELARHGLDVTVFDEGQAPGGRVATRRADGHLFDHGAQYFTVRDDRFRRDVEGWLADGAASEWKGRIVQIAHNEVAADKSDTARYVGVPGMSAVSLRLAEGLEVRAGVRVEDVLQEGAGWRLTAEDGTDLGHFDAVVASTPPPQAAPLLAAAPVLAARVRAVQIAPCWAVLLAFDEPLALPFDAAYVDGRLLAWVARDSSKPGRPEGERWVLHATGSWARSHLEDSQEQVTAALLDAFWQATGHRPLTPSYAEAHRWRYAQPEPGLAVGYLFDENFGLGACGDWCASGRVEGAYLSGLALAERVARWAEAA